MAAASQHRALHYSQGSGDFDRPRAGTAEFHFGFRSGTEQIMIQVGAIFDLRRESRIPSSTDVATVRMTPEDKHRRPKLDLEGEALLALEEARAMPPGAERTEAMKRAGVLRNAVEIRGLFLAKRGRPNKM
jgi:hypothetical protein